MMNPCKEGEPRVINNELITKCIDLQYPKGEVGRLLRLEGIPMEEVEEIRFEYLYILKIDHLWVLKSLVRLSLNNNFIEKIENLETLVHLKLELDLSFNRISKIENLDTLVNLEKVTFYENYIETVENLDHQTKLTVLSLGKNRISDRTYVNYFRRFTALTSLNMAGNPCTEDPEFRPYVAAYLPNLIYYEYKRISDDERAQGIDMFEKPLRKLDEAETEEKEKKDALEKELRDAEMHSKMFVEYLDTGKLFEMMYEHDEEGIALLDIGEEVTELYDEYKAQFIRYCKESFEVGQKHFEIRQTEVENFEKSVEKAKNDSQQESIDHMEAFLEEKKNIFCSIKTLRLQLDHDVISDIEFEEHVEELKKVFEDVIHKTWKNLMRLELTLFEQIEDVTQTYGQVLTEMINNFIEEVQAVFTNIRASEVTFAENLTEAALRYMTAINVSLTDEMPDSLKDHLFDRDTLNNAMTATHDVHMQTIDSREDQLVHRAREWLDALSEQLTKDEVIRNRYKILEISHFLDIQREEFNELSAQVEIVDSDDMLNI